MFLTSDIDYIIRNGVEITVRKDTNNRLTIGVFDFSVLAILENRENRDMVTKAVNDFIIRFVSETELKEALDECMGKPINDSLIYMIKYIIRQKMDYYEHINGLDFQRLLGMHIMNYVQGCLLELETGCVH